MSIIIPVKDQRNKFLITSSLSVATIVWDGVSKTVSDFKILLTLDESSEMRINDGKVSPSGVLFAGKKSINLSMSKSAVEAIYLYLIHSNRLTTCIPQKKF